MGPRGRSATWYRPYAAGLSVVLVLGLFVATATGEERVGRRRQMLALTNFDRGQHDRGDLAFAEMLSRYAKEHSQAMADEGYLFHSTEDELRRALEPYEWSLGGENVGVGGSLETLEEAFMASDAHRQNILRRIYDNAAVGVVRDDDGRFWVTVIFYG